MAPPGAAITDFFSWLLHALCGQKKGWKKGAWVFLMVEAASRQGCSKRLHAPEGL